MRRVALVSVAMLWLLAAIGCRQLTAPMQQSDVAIGVSDVSQAGSLHSRRDSVSKRAARFEIQFLKNMIDHHASALEMTALCPGRTVHPELLQLCQEMHEAQQHEIEMMQQWLMDWYGIAYEPTLKRTDRRMVAHLARLHGEHFEIAFMQTMIHHHEMAIDMAQEATRRGSHQELITMAHEMAEAQTAEIGRMQNWLCSWYRLCHLGDRKHG